MAIQQRKGARWVRVPKTYAIAELIKLNKLKCKHYRSFHTFQMNPEIAEVDHE